VNKVGRGFLKVASDDMADIYLTEDFLILIQGQAMMQSMEQAELVDKSYFKQGTNVLAARVYNSVGSARFDMRLETFNVSRNRPCL